MAAATAEAPTDKETPPTPGNTPNEPLPETSLTPPSTHPKSNDTIAPDIKTVIEAVFAEDEQKRRQSTDPTAAGERSKSRSRSRSRSRPTSVAGERRGSSVWEQDKEKKQRNVVKKIFGHRWVPDFLK